jgi:hypothetical protein
LGRNQVTESKRIPCVSRYASARRNVVDHLTVGIRSASTRTRIFAFIVNAGFVGWTIRVEYALGPATFVRVSDVIRETNARPGSVLFSTLSVCTARRR